MGWSGGTYTKGNQGTGGWAGDESSGIGIEAGRHDTQDNDFANGINNCLTKDGQNTPTANLPMGGYKHINVAAATANDEYATYGQLTASVGASMPAGCIQMYGGSAAPTGFLLCDGGAVSRASYAALFAVVGTTYGAGDGSTTFNVPDLRQKFPLGKAASGTGNTLGGTGGAIDHTHSVPAHYHGKGTLAVGNDTHSHPYSGTTTTTGSAHKHTVPNQSGNANVGDAGELYVLRGGNTTQGGSTGSSLLGTDEGSHTHTYSGTTSSNTHNHPLSGSVGNTGGDNGDSAMTSGANNPPFLVVNYIIKT